MENKMCTEIRRVFLKYIVLKIIKDRPTHGYDIIKTVRLRSKGRWTPSTGSIYPILESLESNGLIQSKEMGNAAGRYTRSPLRECGAGSHDTEEIGAPE